MTTEALMLLACMSLGAAACAPSDGASLLVTSHGESIPAGIADACELASHRCSRCHSIDRIVRSRITEPDEWRRYVHRMRLMPGSAIPPDEESTISRCLVFRVAGRAGLGENP